MHTAGLDVEVETVKCGFRRLAPTSIRLAETDDVDDVCA
jgi:hypothetical protein